MRKNVSDVDIQKHISNLPVFACQNAINAVLIVFVYCERQQILTTILKI